MNTQQQVKALINQYIKTNGQGAITGALLNEVLQAMVGLTGAGYNFAGVATPSTDPGSLTYVAFYIGGPGTYANMGNVMIPDNNIGIIDNSNNGLWTVTTLSILPSNGSINSSKLADNAVTTSKLDDEVVTLAKLASDVIGLLATKADIDGFYSTMGVGAAENLIGRGTVIADFTLRTSGGTADIGSGLARIKKLIGNTIAWNQLVPVPVSDISDTISGVNLHDYRDGTYGVSSAAIYASAQFTIPNIPDIPVGHKVLIMGTPKQPNVQITFKVNGNTDIGSGLIFTNASETITAIINAAIGSTVLTELIVTPQIFDLTQMFGAGKEPSTVAEFKRLFPLDYYKYNEGALISVTATGLKTVGFNAYNPTTGEAFLLGDNKYQVSGTYTALSFDGAAPTLDADGCFTPAKDGILEVTGGNSTDTCVHLVWSGYRNGEFESYWDETLDLPITTLTGKLNGEGESVVLFCNGIRSANNAFDEITAGSGRVVIKSVKIKDLNWLYVSWDPGHERLYTESLNSVIQKPQDNSVAANIKCARYSTANANKAYSHTEDQIIGIESSGIIVIYDSSFSSAAAFISAMGEIEIFYALATPEVYMLDTPLSLNYKVDDFGTEEELPQNDDEPVTSPLRYEVQYAMNAVDTLRRLPENYISKESFLDFLAEFDSKVGAAINATIGSTMTFDSESQKYRFDISVTPNT